MKVRYLRLYKKMFLDIFFLIHKKTPSFFYDGVVILNTIKQFIERESQVQTCYAMHGCRTVRIRAVPFIARIQHNTIVVHLEKLTLKREIKSLKCFYQNKVYTRLNVLSTSKGGRSATNWHMHNLIPTGKFTESFGLVHPVVLKELWSQNLVTYKVSYGQTGAPIERNYKQGLVMLVKISYYLFVCCISPSEKFWHHPSTRLILYYSYTDPLFPPLYSSTKGQNFHWALLYIFPQGRGERYLVPKI